MNVLTARDSLFAELHTSALKPRGYRKKGHWVTRDVGVLTHSFFLRASRFGNARECEFWIDVQIFNQQWHELVFPERPYKGPTEGPCLFLRELGSWCSPPLLTHRITQHTNVHQLLQPLAHAAEQKALPFLTQCETPASLLEHLSSVSEPYTGRLPLVGLSYLLGHEERARELMSQAKAAAAHENELRFLELRERNIWRNAA